METTAAGKTTPTTRMKSLLLLCLAAAAVSRAGASEAKIRCPNADSRPGTPYLTCKPNKFCCYIPAAGDAKCVWRKHKECRGSNPSICKVEVGDTNRCCMRPVPGKVTSLKAVPKTENCLLHCPRFAGGLPDECDVEEKMFCCLQGDVYSCVMTKEECDGTTCDPKTTTCCATAAGDGFTACETCAQLVEKKKESLCEGKADAAACQAKVAGCADDAGVLDADWDGRAAADICDKAWLDCMEPRLPPTPMPCAAMLPFKKAQHCGNKTDSAKETCETKLDECAKDTVLVAAQRRCPDEWDRCASRAVGDAVDRLALLAPALLLLLQ